MEGFYRQKKEGQGKSLLFQVGPPSYRSREGCVGQMTSLALTRKFQVDG